MIPMGVIVLTLACNMPGTSERVAQENMLRDTQEVLSVQQTVMAIGQLTEAANANKPVLPPEQPTARPPEELPTYTPYPTYTVDIPVPTAEPIATATPDFDAWLKTANVLVYEDMKGDFTTLPRVDPALDTLGLNKANIVRVADARGDFLRQLNTGRKWDLIIMAAESRTAPTGEFWESIADLVINNQVALVSETWDLDSYYIGKITPLLTRCGITVHKDWQRDPNTFDIYDYSIYWLEPQHPVFTDPNLIEPLLVSDLFWWWDVGDYIKLKGGDAQILAGTQKKEYSSYGLITTCMEGRVIWQTFSTHDYPAEETTALWQNYITYTLKNRFTALNP
jgi:hypothetical protein